MAEAETWWKWGQATQYLLGQYPCDCPISARELLESKIEDGTLAVRYRTRGGEVCLPIERQEWRRSGDRDFLEWERLEEQSHRDIELGLGTGEFEFQAVAVQRLCTERRASASREGGRPPREIVFRLLVLAGMWIDEQGVPKAGSGEQAALERFLAGQAGDQLKAESRIREIAAQAIGFADAYRKAGI